MTNKPTHPAIHDAPGFFLRLSLIVAEQATALHLRIALSVEVVAVMVSEKKTSFDEF